MPKVERTYRLLFQSRDYQWHISGKKTSVINPMSLPSICGSDEDLRVRYLSLIHHMARIDGHFAVKEVALLEKMVDRFRIRRSRHGEIFAERGYSEEQIKSIFQDLKRESLHYSFILDLMAMAAADGVIVDAERTMLSQIATLIGLSKDEFYNLMNFVRVTSGLEGRSRVDPMYRYAIDSFIDWVREKEIVLFGETTLALDRKVDAQLKRDLPNDRSI